MNTIITIIIIISIIIITISIIMINIIIIIERNKKETLSGQHSGKNFSQDLINYTLKALVHEGVIT